MKGLLRPLRNRDRIAVVVKAVVRAADAWGLTNTEGAALFDVPTATWSRMEAGSYRGTLDQDKVTRASLIIGLFNGFASLFNGPWPLASPMLRPWPGRSSRAVATACSTRPPATKAEVA